MSNYFDHLLLFLLLCLLTFTCSTYTIITGELDAVLNGPVVHPKNFKRLCMGEQSTPMFSIKYSRQLVADCYKSFTLLYSSLDWVLSHWAHFTMLDSFLYCVLLCVYA